MRALALPALGHRSEAPAAPRVSLDVRGRQFLIVSALVWMTALVTSYQSALLVLSLFAFGLAVVGLKRPALGLIGISMLCTLDAITRHLLLTTGGLWRWNSFNYWLLGVMLFSAPVIVRLSDTHSKLLRLISVLLLAELAISPDFELGIQQLLGITTTFGLMVYFLRAADDDEAWYWQGLLSASLSGVGSLMYYVMKDQLPYVNANAWAFFPLTGIFAVCLAFPAALRLGRNVNILASLAMLNVGWVFLSGSRGTLFISLCCMVYLVISTPGTVRRLSYVSVAVILMVAASSWFSGLEDNSIHRLTKMFDSSESAAGRTSGRSDLGLGGYYIFLEHPLGVGTGGFAATWAKLGPRDMLSGFKEGEEFQAHSGWIKILAENGLPGLLLLVAYVLSFARAARRARHPRVRDLSYMVAAALGVAFLSTEFQGKGFWFLAAGVTVLLQRDGTRVVKAPFRLSLVRPA